jgi:sigma-E factor negative regulatory protein RseA
MVNPMDKILKQREMVSALADGELQGEAFALAVETAVGDEDARATWHAYHLVGDVLRSSELSRCAVKDGFMNRLQERLQAEPLHGLRTSLSAAVEPVSDVRVQVASPVVAVGEAANASVFRWKLVAGLASLAAVMAVGWHVLGTTGEAAGPRLASLPPPSAAVPTLVALPSNAATPVATANEPAMVMIRDPHLDALLAAHKQFGGTSALQGPAGFLRNATFEQPGR